MTKGTPSRGKMKRGILHIKCRRCGKKSYHAKKKVCSSCGYGKTPKLRSYAWKKVGKRKVVGKGNQ